MFTSRTYISTLNLSRLQTTHLSIGVGYSITNRSADLFPIVELVHVSHLGNCPSHVRWVHLSAGIRWTIVLNGALKQKKPWYACILPAHMHQVAYFLKGEEMWEAFAEGSCQFISIFIADHHIKKWLHHAHASTWLTILQDYSANKLLHRMVHILSLDIEAYFRRFLGIENESEVAELNSVYTLDSYLSLLLEQALMGFLHQDSCDFISEDERVFQIVSQMVEELDKPISVNQIRKRTGLSSVRLNAIFKQFFNTTIAAFVTDIRIKRAKEMLANSRESVASVAVQVGYSSPNYFSRVFGKKVGKPPLLYRSAASLEDSGF